MTTSRASMLSEPTETVPIPNATLVYFRARLKQRMFDALLKEYKRSGLTKAELAARLCKDPAQISRLLSGPGNVTLDTMSDILLALSGAELAASLEYPFATRPKSASRKRDRSRPAAPAPSE